MNPPIPDQVRVGAVFRLARPAPEADHPRGHHGVIGPPSARHLLIEEAERLPHTLDAAEDAVAGQQYNLVGEVTLQIPFLRELQ